MSKFIDKLKQVSQAVPQSMGFRVEPVSEKPKILLIASLTRSNVNDLAKCVAGADAALLHISNLSSGGKTLQKMRQIASDIPWGGWLRDTSGRGIKQMVKIDCDFLVFPAANTSLTILQNDEVGKIIEVEASLNEGLLRTINELPADAVLITGEKAGGSFLTWHHLMIFQRFADLLAKPLLASMPSTVTASELQVLWKAGVDGVVVEVGVKQPERLEELRQAIDKLTFPSKRRWGKTEALLPYVSGEKDIASEEEEELLR